MKIEVTQVSLTFCKSIIIKKTFRSHNKCHWDFSGTHSGAQTLIQCFYCRLGSCISCCKSCFISFNFLERQKCLAEKNEWARLEEMSEDEYNALPEEERQAIDKKRLEKKKQKLKRKKEIKEQQERERREKELLEEKRLEEEKFVLFCFICFS